MASARARRRHPTATSTLTSLNPIINFIDSSPISYIFSRLRPNMSALAFVQSHLSQILATGGLVAYSLLRNKLTAGGIFAGVFVATIHMVHPWPAFFWLLILFFAFGTVVTKVSPLLPSARPWLVRQRDGTIPPHYRD